jgi:hypothetical protein
LCSKFWTTIVSHILFCFWLYMTFLPNFKDTHTCMFINHILYIITPYIRMLSSDWLMKGVFFFTNSSFFSFSIRIEIELNVSPTKYDKSNTWTPLQRNLNICVVFEVYFSCLEVIFCGWGIFFYQFFVFQLFHHCRDICLKISRYYRKISRSRRNPFFK